MEKNNKGLADMQEGEFILNESGTAVSVDNVEGVDTPILNSADEAKKSTDDKNCSSSD